MNKRVVSAGLAAGLAGGLAGTVLLSPGVALGQSDTPTAVEQKALKRGTPYADAIAGLVADGTLTQAQADKVLGALKAARPEGRHGHDKKKPFALDAAAKALGVTVAELRTALAGGQSIADVATAKGVAVPTVVDALVADYKARLDKMVAAGKLTQDDADKKLEAMRTKITKMAYATKSKVGRKVKPGSTDKSVSTTTLRSA